MASLFLTKPVEKLIAETQESGRSLRRVLGPIDLIALGIGATIGAGIFATIGTAAAGDSVRPGAGPALILSFVLTAVVCAFTGLCYAELASLVPVSGSAYTFTYVTLGEIVAWIIGWDLIIEYAIGNVAVAISWANYCNTLLAGFGLDLPRWLAVDYRTAAQKMPEVMAAAPHVFGIPIVFNLLAIGVVAVLSVVLVWGVRESSRATTVMVVIKLLVLGLFVLVGIRFIKPENWQPFAPNGFAGVAAGAAIVFFAYIGFDAVSTCAEETRRPGRDLPIGILGSLAASTLIYVVVAVVFTGLVPFPALQAMTASDQAEPLTVALRYVGRSNTTVSVVAFGSVVAHTAVLLVFQLGQARIFMAMARDGLLPAPLARIHPRFRTPHVATILTGIGVGVLAAVSNIDEMVDLTNIGTLFAFLLVCIGVSILRFKAPDRPRPFRVPFGPVLVPALGALFCVGMITHLPRTSWIRFGIWLAVGLVVYTLYGYRHSHLRAARLSEAAPPSSRNSPMESQS
jgi:APA family basic amino acid/polyamine antiporter